jgi:hypothetical protein
MTNDTSQAPVASTINSYIDAVSNWFIWTGDARDILKNIPDESVQCCVTSPPYFGLRSYLPNGVRLRDDLTDEERSYVLSELEKLGIHPTSGEV